MLLSSLYYSAFYGCYTHTLTYHTVIPILISEAKLFFFFCLPAWLSIWPYVRPYISPTVCLFICLSICPSVCLIVCLSIFLVKWCVVYGWITYNIKSYCFKYVLWCLCYKPWWTTKLVSYCCQSLTLAKTNTLAYCVICPFPCISNMWLLNINFAELFPHSCHITDYCCYI